MHLTMDFETRSRCNLKATGPWPYAEDPTTQVLCLAIKEDDKPARLWLPSATYGWLPIGHGLDIINVAQLYELVGKADTIEAHNAEFEQAIWWGQMMTKFSAPEIPLDRWRCSAAKAAVCALPRSLGQACNVLGVPVQKDGEGYKIMMRFCKPQKRKSKDGTTEYWHEDPQDFVKLCRYCLTDTEAEHALSRALPALSARELAIWRMDQRINRRGMLVDRVSSEALVHEVAKEEAKLLAEFRVLTRGLVTSPKKVDAFLQYLSDEYHVQLEDLRKSTVLAALEEGEDDDDE